MKKSAKIFFVTLMLGIISMFAVLGAGCGEAETPFTVGKDTATYEVDGHSEWASTYSAYVRIIAGEDELFNGTVTLTSDNMWMNEFTIAAVEEKGIGQEGLEAGFVTKIGEYEGSSDLFWFMYLNGKYVSWACNEMHIFEGDYIEWKFENINAHF